MTEASEHSIEEPEFQAENAKKKVVAKTTKKPALNAWTEEQEKILTELLKIHKWCEWGGIAAAMPNRTAAAIEAKLRKVITIDHNTSIVKKELYEIAKLVKIMRNYFN